MASILDLFRKKRPVEGNDLEAVMTAEKQPNFLSQFLPEDEEKRNAVARALIMGGAHTMAAGGASSKPVTLMEAIGKGLAGGIEGYDAAREADIEAAKVGVANRAANVKLQQAADAQKFAASMGGSGNGAYSIEDLKRLHSQYLAMGEYSAANSILERIQRLDDERRKDGLILTDEGYQLAPGITDSQFQIERAKSLGSAVGQNEQITADQKDFRAGQADPAFRLYEQEKARESKQNINVNTAPKDGEIWKAMDKERENATGAQSALRQVYEMKQAIPNAITGFGADYLLAGQKAIAAMGGDASRVVDTETLQTSAMEMAARMKGDLVGNQQISDSDMVFVQKVAAGDIRLDGGTIKRMVDIREKSLVGQINKYNSRIDQIYPDTPENSTNRNYFGGVGIPENPYAKAGVSTETNSDAGASSGAGVAVVSSQSEYEALPPGSPYRFANEPATMVRTKR